MATREGILDAALNCFHEFGVAGTTLAMIGARAGYTRGAVYWHFENKAEVLKAVLSRERTPFLARLRRITSAERDTPVLDLRSALLVSLLEVENQPRIRSLMEIMLRNDLSVESHAMQEMQREASLEELAMIGAGVARAGALGQLREGVSPETVARVVHACMIGVLYSAMLQPELFDVMRDGTEVLDAVLLAYVVPGVFIPGAALTPLPEDDGT